MQTLEWRLFGVEVPAVSDVAATAAADYNVVPGVSASLHHAVAERLGIASDELPIHRITLVRKSLDARPVRIGGSRSRRSSTSEREVCWSHVVDVQLDRAHAKGIKAQPGRIVPAAKERVVREEPPAAASGHSTRHVVVIGAGPCGLFAALTLARSGHRVTLCERGKPVEERGRSIGALVKRGVLDQESNFCYGEGGAGTWSDGKLTTRIGRNSAEVRTVLEALVEFGAPERILLDGKPHLGTDNLVRLLKNFRRELLDLGATIHWDARVAELMLTDHDGATNADSSLRHVRGVRLASGEALEADGVVLAAGHSARELYEHLVASGATLHAKDFAVGFRIEHPQSVINAAQYGEELANEYCQTGGQIVPTSITADKLCINGMSYSNRGSKWANSALVVTVGQTFGDYDAATAHGGSEASEKEEAAAPARGGREGAGPAAGGDGTTTGDESSVGSEAVLAGLAFQEVMEARAAVMGGGELKCPVQRVSDFLDGRLSEEPLPTSSYRLGVTSAPLHELYPPGITSALRDGLRRFAKSMPGFDGENALLHGVETRTSAPVQIVRNRASCEAMGLPGLYPAGEGAGYAGGIISAAVDGVRVAEALARALGADTAKEIIEEEAISAPVVSAD